MPEAHLRCSLNSSDSKTTAFLTELTDAEANHVLTLDSLSKRSGLGDLPKEIVQPMVEHKAR